MKVIEYSKVLPVIVLFAFFIQFVSCKKDEIVEEPIETVKNSFEFYPTKDAVWIQTSKYSSGGMNMYYVDSFYIGTDTILYSKTLHPLFDSYEDCEPATEKKYTEIKLKTTRVSDYQGVIDTLVTSGRYGFYRQEEESRRLYAPVLHNGTLYEELRFDFSQKVGDTCNFARQDGYVFTITRRDTIPFGIRNLMKLEVSAKSSNFTYPYNVIQCWDISVGQVFSPNLNHPTSYIYDFKFIYQGDTLRF